jgi:steroid delta-isomerase-like uncharacterized protein
MFEQNKAIVRRSLEELFTHGDLGVADEVFAADYVGHDTELPQPLRGPEEVKRFVAMYRTAFPDLVVSVEDQIAEGDRVVTRFVARGTHRGPLMGIPPTGRKVTVPGISIDRIVDGKSAEAWINYDVMGMMQQLGVLTGPTAPSPDVREQPRH